MDFLGGIRTLFAKKDKNSQSLDRISDINKVNIPFSGDEKPGDPLPVIGKYPYPTQIKILLLLTVGIGILFFALFLSAFLFSTHNAEMRDTSTGLQMLSQRVVMATNAGMQGDDRGFDRVNEYIERFDANISAVENESALWLNNSEEKNNYLTRLQLLWRENFGDAKRANMRQVLAQRKQLVDVAKSVSEVMKDDKQTELLISVINRVLPYYDEEKATINYFAQMGPLYLNMSKSASMLLSGETSVRAVYEVLGQDVRKWQQIAKTLREGDKSAGVPAFRSPVLLNAVGLVEQQLAPLVRIASELNTSSAALDNAYQANRLLARDSETFAELTGALANYYDNRSHTLVTSILLFVLAAVGLLALYLLARVFNQEALQKRLQSEAENKANQEAILRLLNDMADLADGDLTVRAMVTEDLTGAIADSINYTVEELRSLIVGINGATEQVTRVTGQAQQVSDELLQAAGKQSEEIENTNQTVRMIVQSVQGVASSAAQSSKVAHASLSAAEQGVAAVNNQIKGMNEIREQIQETSKRIKRLGESSQEIGEIVELISDITEQTNVLALNAAIQAAAAGDAGRGFSVVAEEVQRLAERSGEATKQIAAIVKTIQADTHDAVAAMEVSTQGVVEGAKLSDAAGSALSEIGQVSRELARIIESIALETEDQSLLAERVNTSMRDILAITEQTMQSTRSSADAVGQLTGLAAGLKSSVAGFKV